MKIHVSHHKGIMVAVLLVSLTAVPVFPGCSRRPDPRDNPEFNEAALDPSTIQLQRAEDFNEPPGP